MAQSPSPDDRADPSDRLPAVRARVPEHVAVGQISTGVIVVTGATEFILDFVRNLPRPNMIVARVVLPHTVMPQFADALATNISLYRQRFGDIPPTDTGNSDGPITSNLQGKPIAQHAASSGASANDSSIASAKPSEESSAQGGVGSAGGSAASASSNLGLSQDPTKSDASGLGSSPPSSSTTRHSSPQEVYDDLKLKDELLSGAYANAVMIGHGPHEFCFDFITNFYPQSAVSCRVFMAAGHVGRLLESLRASWDQLRPRLGGM